MRIKELVVTVSETAVKDVSCLNIETYTTTDVFDELRDEWNALVERSTTNTIFSTIQWHENWWNAYCPGELWVHSVRDGETLVGIASLFIENSDAGQRIVRCIGCEDVTDYLDLIVDADRASTVYAAIAEHLIKQHDKFDAISLCNIPAESPTLDMLKKALEDAGEQVTITQQEVCPVIELPEAWDDYLANLDKKQRHEIRRKLRHAQGQKRMGGLDWYIVDESHDLDAEIDYFIDLMAKSHPEKAGFLEDDQHVQFFKTMIPAVFEQGWLQLNFLVLNETDRAAAYLNFVYNDRVYVYNSGLDPEAHSRLSPGIILLSYNIQHAIDAGISKFDFLRGDEHYKYRMGGQDTPVFNLRTEPHS